ncbi:DUF5906 domain-containing protein [Bradyrhizobium sp. SZCCHNS2096]|uniref:DUF5906 domain-containing protein n=1 Tax=Bradyrhizobium sp. SZCCHNS2096 TaxID=3057309 RepID=UPI0029168E78|nr:DUF5906 domain-containing protein [Bradyrhizobium sp. SZCCHNS2096]
MTKNPDQSVAPSPANPAPTGGVFRSEGVDAYAAIADLVERGRDQPETAPEAVQKPQEASTALPRSWGFDVHDLNQRYALAIWGGKAVVVNEQPSGPVNDRVRIMSFESMNSWFANKFTEILGSDGKIRSVTWARAWHQHPERRQYDGVEFFPNPDGTPATANYINLWRGFSVEPSCEGSCGIFKYHLLTNVCGGDPELFKWVFGWMAHIIQKPRERIGTALVLRGRRGTGKSKVGEVLGSLFSPHHFQVDEARYVTGQFNAHMASCLLLQADEAVWAGDKAAEGKLKGLITSDTQMIESKGVDPIRLKNYLRVIMTSNEGWVVPAGVDERRFCVLDVQSNWEQNNTYFAEMDRELDSGGRARLLDELQHFDLDQVDLWRIPKTRALLDQKLRSLESIERFWFDRLHDGEMVDGAPWPERIICANLYHDYLKASSQIGVSRKRSSAEFGIALAKLVPGLRKERPSIETEPGIARRTWCYILPSLTEARSAFADLLGQLVDWPALPTGESRRAQESAMDEPIPF